MAKKKYYLVEFDFAPKKDSEPLSSYFILPAQIDTDAIAMVEKLAKSAKYEVCDVTSVDEVPEQDYKDFQKSVYRVEYDMAKTKDKEPIASHRTVKAPDPFTAIETAKKQVNAAGFKVFLPTSIDKCEEDEE